MAGCVDVQLNQDLEQVRLAVQRLLHTPLIELLSHDGHVLNPRQSVNDAGLIDAASIIAHALQIKIFSCRSGQAFLMSVVGYYMDSI